jgi:hypothetical protein
MNEILLHDPVVARHFLRGDDGARRDGERVILGPEHELLTSAGTPFDRAPFAAAMCNWEKEWLRRHDLFATRPRGDPLAVSRRLYMNYRAALEGGGPVQPRIFDYTIRYRLPLIKGSSAVNR